MAFASWLRALQSAFLGTRPHRKRRRTHRRRLVIETLEDRLAPAQIVPLASFTTSGFLQYGLVVDSSGDLFGTTQAGGTYDYGTVFEVIQGSKSITTLASFTAPAETGIVSNLPSAVVEDSNGDLFGTTTFGGTYDSGTVFEVVRGSNTITTLAPFNYYTNGNQPSGLVVDSSGHLFGTTLYGPDDGPGTVFELTPGINTINTLAAFNDGSNGGFPEGGLFEDSNGDLFGTTTYDGTYGDGTVFKVAHNSKTITPLASFNSDQYQLNGVVEDSSGNLFGTAYSSRSDGSAIVFEVTPDSGAFTTLASFNSNAFPSGLVVDSSGALFGTTQAGGTNGYGTVFEVTPATKTINTLVSFNYSDGAEPYGLVEDSSGNLFGTTQELGTYDYGTVFEVVFPPEITTQPGNATITYGQSASFTAAATGRPDPSVQWEASSDGGTTFTPLSNGTEYSGVTSDTLTITGASPAQSGDEYDAVFTNASGTATSQAASLTVSPAATATDLSSSLDPATFGETMTFSAAVSDTSTGSNVVPAGSVQFYIDGSAYGSPVTLDNSGRASTTDNSLQVTGSPYSITASYSNSDGNFSNSTGSLAGGQTVNPAPTLLGVTAPADSDLDTPTPVTVTALVAAGDSADLGYTGTIHLSSSTDPSAVFANADGQPLPGNDYTFTGADDASQSFLVTFQNSGNQTVTATDVNSSITGSATTDVSPTAISNGVLYIGMGPGTEDVTLRLDPNNSTTLDVWEGTTLLQAVSLSPFTNGVWVSSIVVSGDSNPGRLTLDYSNGNPIPSIYGGGLTYPLTYTGGGSDALVIEGDSSQLALSDELFSYTGPQAGSINFDISYTGLASILAPTAVDYVYLYFGTSQTISLDDAGAGMTTATASGGATPTTFANPASELLIEGAGSPAAVDADTLNLNGFGSGYNAGLNVEFFGTINLNTPLTIGAATSDGNVWLDAQIVNLYENIDTTQGDGGQQPGNVTLAGDVRMGPGVTINTTNSTSGSSGTVTVNDVVVNGPVDPNGNAGQLDDTFGPSQNGTVLDPLATPVDGFQPVIQVGYQDMVIEPVGSVIVVGKVTNKDPSYTFLYLAHFNSQGGLEAKTIVDVGAFYFDPFSSAVAVEPNGGDIIVVGGFGVLAFNPTSLDVDPSFGSGGFVPAPPDSSGATVTIEPTNHGNCILVAYAFRNNNDGSTGWNVARYLANSSPDSTFGSDGIAHFTVPALLPSDLTPIFGEQALGDSESLAIQPNGVIVFAGAVLGDVSTLVLVRFNSLGNLDTSFGNGGIVLNENAIVGVDPNDERVAVGGVDIAGARINLADFKIILENGGELYSYNSDGTPDISFNGSAAQTNNNLDGLLLSSALVVEQVDHIGPTQINEIVLASPDPDTDTLRLSRFFPDDGSADTAFGIGGTVTTAVGPAAAPYQVAINGSEIIVAGVSVDSAGNPCLALASYDAYPLVASELIGGGLVFPLDANGNIEGEQNPGYTGTLTSTFLQSLINLTSPNANGAKLLTFDAGTNAAIDSFVTAASGLSTETTPVTLQLSLASGTYQAINIPADPLPANVTFIISGEGQPQPVTIEGGAGLAALTVGSGSVVVTGVTLTTATDSPTILVQGGTLQLENDTIEQTATGSDFAIAVSAGSVDLGTTANPGGNIVNVSGTGGWVDNETTTPILAVGDTFEIDGVAQTSPQAFAASYTLNENGVLSVPALGVLANDLDANGEALTAVLANGPTYGTLVLNADGSFTYTPDANFAGTDSFSYQAENSDGTLSNTATVTLDVNVTASQFVISGLPTSTDPQTSQSFMVTAEDSSGRIATDYSGIITFTSSDSQAALPVNSTLTNGVGSFNASFQTAGNQTLTVTDTANSLISGSGSVFVNPRVVTWTGAVGDGNWNTPGNWSINAVPGPNDAVVIDVTGATVTHSAHVANSVYSLTSQDALLLSGGSLSIATASTINNALTVSQATLDSSALIVTGLFTWEEGTLQGLNGGGSLTAADGFSFGNLNTLKDYTLVIPSGQIASGDADFLLSNGATIDNYGTFNWVCDSGLISGDATTVFNNYGAYVQSTGFANSANRFFLPVNNYGSIAVQLGTLVLGQGSSAPLTNYAGSSLTGASGTVVSLQGPSTFPAGSTIGFDNLTVGSNTTFDVGFAANSFNVTGGTTSITKDFTANSVSATSGTATFTGDVHHLGNVVIQNGALLDLSAATLDPAATTLSSLDLENHGALRGAFDFAVSGLFSDVAGTLDGAGGAGSLTADGGFSFGNLNTLTGYTLVIPSGQTASGDADFLLSNGAAIDNYGTFNWVCDSGLISGDATTVFNNYGAYVQSTGFANSANRFFLPVNNYGSIAVQLGTLVLGQGSSAPLTNYAGSSLTGARGTVVNLQGPSTFDAGSTIDADSVQVSSTSTTFAGDYTANNTTVTSGTATFTGAVHQLGNVVIQNRALLDLSAATLDPAATTLSSLDLDNVGTLRGAFDFAVSGLFSDVAGTLDGAGGAGSLTADGGFSFGNLNTLKGYTLVIPSGQTASGDADFLLSNGAAIDNYGTFNWVCDSGLISGDATTVFNNYGAYVQSTGFANSANRFFLPVNNYGGIAVQLGTLVLGQGSSAPLANYAGSSLTGASGTVVSLQGPSTFPAGSTIGFDNLTVGSNTTFVVGFTANSFNVTGGTASITKDFTANAVSVTSGTATFTGAVHQLGNVVIQNGALLDLSAATLDPAATTLSSLDLDNVGTLRGAFDFAVSGLFSDVAGTLDGAGGAGSLTADGGFSFGNLNTLKGYTLVIPSGQTASGDADFLLSNGAAIDNYGTFNWVCDSGLISGDATTVFNNYGAYVQSTGFANSANRFFLPVNNYGSIAVQLGTLVLGQGKATPLTEEIGGSGAGTQYGQVEVTTEGSVSLAGSLNVVLANGFAPQLGEQFMLINNEVSTPVSGIFVGLPEGGIVTDGPYKFQISYAGGAGNDVVLTAIVVPPLVSVTDGGTYNGSAYGATGTAVGLNGTPVAGSFSYTYYAGSTATGSGSSVAPVNAGMYTVVASFTSADPGYTDGVSAPVTFTIAPAILTVTANDATQVYGTASPSLTYAITGFVNGETSSVVSGDATLATSATASSGVGTYPITVAPGSLSAANYTFALVNGTLTVTAATLTVTARDATIVFGRANPTFTDTITGFVNGDKATVVSGTASLTTSATPSSGVGTYAITAAQGSLSAANYTFVFVDGTLTVTPATLRVRARHATQVYGAATPTFTAAITGFVNGDTASVLSGSASLTTSATSSSGVGTYAIVAAEGSLSAANYLFKFVNGTLSVTPAVLTVTPADSTMVYGASVPTLTDTIAGFVSSDPSSVVSGSAALATAATDSSDVGNYAITVGLGSLSAANYTFKLVNGTLAVTPATLTVTANDASKVYGDANPTFTDTITGFVNGDTSSVISGNASLKTTATKSSGVGTYPITAARGTLHATDYTFAFVGATLTIDPATLTVTAKNASTVYGAALPSFTDTITGFVNGDNTASAVSGSASLSTMATASSAVGTYAIAAAQGSLSAANYVFVFQGGALTVTPAVLTVTANDATKVSGTANPTFTDTITGYVNRDTATVLSGSASLTTTATTSSPVGTYTITAALGTLSAANYTFVFVDGKLRVTKP